MTEPRPRLPILTPELVDQLFVDLLPGSAPVAEVTRFAEGSVSGAYRVSFAGGTAGPVLVKVPAWNDQWMAAKEVYVYRLLAEHGISLIPEVLAFQESTPLLNQSPCTVLSLLPGRPLNSMAEELDEAEQFDIYRQLGQLLASIHGIRMDGYGDIETGIVDPQPDNVTAMTKDFESKVREYLELGGDTSLAAAVAELVTGWSAHFAACRQPALCHGDLNEGNLLVHRDPAGRRRLTGLIDMENVHAADPLADFVRAERFSIKENRSKRAGLLAGYGPGGTDWPQDWQDRMDPYRLRLTLELWCWCTISGGHEHLPGLERDLRRLTGA